MAMLKKFRCLLLPLSLFYGLVVFLRNKFYDWGIFKSVKFDIPIICVGNLAIGGSGKTPTVEYLVKLLNPKYKLAILSRGYGRKTTGFILADENADSVKIGDEPSQYRGKFKEITVAVCEDRVYGINKLKAGHDLIILDDAFQHRAVKAGLNILLFEYENTKFPQFLLPAGNLRESFIQTRRADMILITKSPAMAEKSRFKLRKKLNLKAQSLSFSSVKYQTPVHFFNKNLITDFSGYAVILLTGIANPKPLVNYLKDFTTLIQHFNFPDHYQFTKKDMQKIATVFQQIFFEKKMILTTEKDYQRLAGNNFKDLLLNLPIFYLPIEFDLAPQDKADFDQKILRYVANA